MARPVYRVTTVGHEPTPEQRDRERAYLVMMGIRFVAVILAVVLPGWWRVLPVVLGTFLPYVAVVLVNAVHARDSAGPGQQLELRRSASRTPASARTVYRPAERPPPPANSPPNPPS